MKRVIEISEELYKVAKEGWYTHSDYIDGMKVEAQQVCMLYVRNVMN